MRRLHGCDHRMAFRISMFPLSLTMRRSQAPLPAIFPVSVTSGRSPVEDPARTTDSTSSSELMRPNRVLASRLYPAPLGTLKRTAANLVLIDTGWHRCAGGPGCPGGAGCPERGSTLTAPLSLSAVTGPAASLIANSLKEVFAETAPSTPSTRMEPL